MIKKVDGEKLGKNERTASEFEGKSLVAAHPTRGNECSSGSRCFYQTRELCVRT